MEHKPFREVTCKRCGRVFTTYEYVDLCLICREHVEVKRYIV